MQSFVLTKNCKVNVDIWLKGKAGSEHLFLDLSSEFNFPDALPKSCNMAKEIVVQQNFPTLPTSRLIYVNNVRARITNDSQLKAAQLAELTFLITRAERKGEALCLTMADVETIVRRLNDVDVQVATEEAVTLMRKYLVLAV